MPRTLRFKPEIIIVGTIPGPHKPKLTINTFLKSMIDELIELWKGIQIKAPNSTLGVCSVQVALHVSVQIFQRPGKYVASTGSRLDMDVLNV